MTYLDWSGRYQGGLTPPVREDNRYRQLGNLNKMIIITGLSNTSLVTGQPGDRCEMIGVRHDEDQDRWGDVTPGPGQEYLTSDSLSISHTVTLLLCLF